MALENYIIPEESGQPSYPKLNLHLFRAILQEFIEGQKTGTECRAAIEWQLGVTLTTDDVSDITSMISNINAETTVPEKLAVLDEYYRCFICAENGLWYDTRDKLRIRLSFI